MDIILEEAAAWLVIPVSFLLYALVIVFLHCFYDRGFLWNKKKAILLLLYLLAMTVIERFIREFELLYGVLSFAFLILETVIILYDYSGKWYKGLARWILGILFIDSFLIITETAVGLYILPISETSSLKRILCANLIWSGLIITTLCPMFFYLFYRVYKQGIVLKCRKRERVFTVVYVFLSFVLGVLLEGNSKTDTVTFIILGIFVILASVLLPAFIFYLRISEHYQERTKHQESYMQAELAHFQQYKVAQEETNRFRHDVRNNLLCLDQLLIQGKTQEAETYVKSLLEITETLRPKYVTGDEILDSILGVKGELMTQKGIEFQLDGVLAGGLFWKSVDVCSVFANALDNAMEACEKLPEGARYITMRIKATPQFWMVRIENPVQGKVDVGKLFQKDGGYTSKSQGLHGIGTYNMKHTVESYGGMVKADCADGTFVLEIMIDKSRV